MLPDEKSSRESYSTASKLPAFGSANNWTPRNSDSTYHICSHRSHTELTQAKEFSVPLPVASLLHPQWHTECAGCFSDCSCPLKAVPDVFCH